ncbi:MAG: hypothetical protein ACOCV4_08865, partial [Myxococcota bacterium]
HYNLALQTLTPLALQLSNRKNMRSNQYEPIAQAMAARGVPIATELIWGLPGDNLAEFEANLDRLSAIFPNINIFGYTLLPGTEFYERRDEYRIEAVPVAGYGKAKGEYVIGCHTFERDEGIEGYFLITAHIVLVRGYVMPLTSRLLALEAVGSVSALLRAVLRALVQAFASDGPNLDLQDRMGIYENRDRLYLAMLRRPDECFRVIDDTVMQWMRAQGATEAQLDRARKTLAIDEACCPRVGPGRTVTRTFDFPAGQVLQDLGRMQLPGEDAFTGRGATLHFAHPGHVGEVLRDPDGGSWMRGQPVQDAAAGEDVVANPGHA